MGRREISTSGIILIVLISSFVAIGGFLAYTNGDLDFLLPGMVGPGGQPVDLGAEELNRFSIILDKEDAAGTLIASETAAIWCDWNGDGIMQTDIFRGYNQKTGLVAGEIEPASSAATTALLTSPSPYPFDRDIWIFVDTGKDAGGRTYQIEYAKFQMTGKPNLDGSAKHLGTVYCRATDDGSLDYAGLIGGVAIDDSTDYNYTANGAEADFELRIKLATSDAGWKSQTDPVFYSSSGSYYNWVSGKDYAPTFIGMYMTNQDFIDLGMDTSDFDFVYQGASNTYVAKFMDDFDDDSDTFYDSDDSVAPTFTFSFAVDITAAGSITYIGLYQDVEWSDFVLGIWGDTTDNQVLGTLGADWDWVA
ncbi:MAG: hypothetical protein ACTSWQ_00475 [Candidatus Thorarchaeota archaeon]